MNMYNNSHNKEFSTKQMTLLSLLVAISFTGIVIPVISMFLFEMNGFLLILFTIVSLRLFYLISVKAITFFLLAKKTNYFYSPSSGEEMKCLASLRLGNYGNKIESINVVYFKSLSCISLCSSVSESGVGLHPGQSYVMSVDGNYLRINSGTPSFGELAGYRFNLLKEGVNLKLLLLSVIIIMNLSTYFYLTHLLEITLQVKMIISVILLLAQIGFWFLGINNVLKSRSCSYCRVDAKEGKKFLVLLSVKYINNNDSSNKYLFIYRYINSNVINIGLSSGEYGLDVDSEYILDETGYFIKQFPKRNFTERKESVRKQKVKPKEPTKKEIIKKLILTKDINRGKGLLQQLLKFKNVGFMDLYELALISQNHEISLLIGSKILTYSKKTFKQEFLELAENSYNSSLRELIQIRLIRLKSFKDLVLYKYSISGETKEIRLLCQQELSLDKFNNSDVNDYFSTYAETEELREIFLENLILQMNEKDPI